MIDISDLDNIGYFMVDSGQAIIGDPCYLDDWEAQYTDFAEYKNSKGKYGYLGSCEATLNNGSGVLEGGKAIAFTTGHGDGYYPVYVEYNKEGYISKVVIDFELGE